MQFMQEQLQQMQNEADVAFNQIKLIKEQLNLEIAARIDAQVRTNFLAERNSISSNFDSSRIKINKLSIEIEIY